MRPHDSIRFPPFCLDLVDERLRRGGAPVPLTPRAYSVLRYLLERAGRLVTKEEILGAVWRDTHVQDAVLKVCIREIRRALDDSARAPRFIETVHRRGYRFAAPLIERPPATGGDPFSAAFVGRERELARLRGWFEQARRGERQVVFVMGEPGIGKTAVVEAFLRQIAPDHGLWIARGTCLERYGAGEAYRPVLEALGRLARGKWKGRLRAVLSSHAPTWLTQLPSLVREGDRERLQQEILGATSERMLREMAEAIESLTAETSLVLVLEDLHWSDYSTLDLIASLARRRERAHLLVIGTYRQAEILFSHHPLRAIKQELQMRRQCHELPLDYLTPETIGAYLATRFPATAVPEKLAASIHRRTNGNPLFMVNVVDYLVSRDVIGPRAGSPDLPGALDEVETGVPEDLRQMIEKQFERLPAMEQAVLESASVAGAEFSALAVAAGLGGDAPGSGEVCETLAHRGLFLRSTGFARLPDGTHTARYGFIHPLYRQVLYERVPPVMRLRLHRRIGERGIAVYGERVDEIAAELAMHFEQARDFEAAVEYLRRAADNAARRYANREAIDHLNRAFDLVGRLPERGRGRLQRSILEQVGMVRRSMGDMRGAAEDFTALVAGAREDGRPRDEARGLFYLGSALFWFDRERFEASADRALELSHLLQDDLLRAHAGGYAAYWHLLLKGWDDQDAAASSAAVAAARGAGDRRLLGLHLVRHAYFRCLQSAYDDGCAAATEAMRFALDAGDGFDYMLCQFFLAWGLLHAGRWGEMRTVLERGIRMAENNGHQLWATLFRLELAWLHGQAFDFERARQLCEVSLQQARRAENGHARMIGEVFLAHAQGGLGRDGAARHSFEEAGRPAERRTVLMDRSWQMPLGVCAGEYWLGQGDTERARLEAECVRAVAARSGERTYVGLSHALLARIAMRAGDTAGADAAFATAVEAIAGVRSPVAIWKVQSAGAILAAARGIDAGPFRSRAAAALRQLATSLDNAPDLRAALLGAPAVREMLEGEAP